jgi:RNA polymerase sigma-70 factor (ECF subfamily)
VLPSEWPGAMPDSRATSTKGAYPRRPRGTSPGSEFSQFSHAKCRTAQEWTTTPEGFSSVHTQRDLSEQETHRQRFTELVRPELEVLHRASLNLCTQPADADDLFQDTLLRAYRAMDTFDGRRPRAWLFTIMRNLAINHARKRRPALLGEAVESSERELLWGIPVPRPEDVAEAATFDDVVMAALASLPMDTQRLVRLVDVEGFSIGESALLMGMSSTAARSRLHRARRSMRERLMAAPPSGWSSRQVRS